MKKIFLFFSCLLLSLLLLAQKTKPVSLETGFKDPPVWAKPKALWPWVNGNVNLSQITYEMEEAKRKGMGGLDIWDVGTSVDPDKVVPAGPTFLGEKSLEAIAYTIREGDRLGLEIGLTFASSWNAGGSWVKPEHGAMGLFRKDTIVTGPVNVVAIISIPELTEKYDNERKRLIFKNPQTGFPEFFRNVAVLAHPTSKDSTLQGKEIIDITDKMDSTGKINWQVPAGTWRIVRYICMPTGQPLAIPSPNSNGLMLDHFSAEAQRVNMKYIFERLLPVTGSLKNRSLKYLYGDSYEVNSAVWTPLLPEAFYKGNHYSLIRYLPVLDGYTIDNNETTRRFIFDFTKTLSNLIIENHYQLGRKICEQYGIGFYAEAGGPGKPIHNVPFEDLKALGALTVPRGEFWNKHPQLEILQIIKGISSASHIYNQKFVEAESFTSVWLWQEGPDELKPLADRAMCEGLNRFVYHTFPHTPPESGYPGWVYNFGTLINTTNGWWPKSQGFHEYLGRCSYLLQEGNFRGDVAFYYGDEAPNFVPPKHLIPSLGFGYDYDVVNSDAILNKMQVKNGRIYLPHGQYYEVLVLPDEIRMSPDVLKKLERMTAAGAIIIGPKPSSSYGLYNKEPSDKSVHLIAERLWGKCDSVHVQEQVYGKGKIVWGKTIREVLSQKGNPPDIRLPETIRGNTLDFIHRTAKAAEIYFLRNVSNKPFMLPVRFRIKNMQPEIWDPETGTITPVTTYQLNKEGVELALPFSGYGSCFIVFRKTNKKVIVNGISLDNKKLFSEKIDGSVLRYVNKGVVTTSNGLWQWNAKGKSLSKQVKMQDAINLPGPWVLHFDQRWNAIASDTMHSLIPLNQSVKEQVKYYSGTVAYHHTFNFDKDKISKDELVLLNLGKVKEIAGIYLNGQSLGLLWHQPYETDITAVLRNGENNLVIEVVTTNNNLLVGDAKLPLVYKRTRSNINKLPNAWQFPFSQAPLQDAGLIGPVELRFAEKLY
ncbi:MAG: glycosyl hydrolase [Ferruginibacter sp.]